MKNDELFKKLNELERRQEKLEHVGYAPGIFVKLLEARIKILEYAKQNQELEDKIIWYEDALKQALIDSLEVANGCT